MTKKLERAIKKVIFGTGSVQELLNAYIDYDLHIKNVPLRSFSTSRRIVWGEKFS